MPKGGKGKAAKKAAPAKKKAPSKPKTQRKPSRVDLFVVEYLKDLNGRQAAIRAGYSPASARQTACDLLSEPEVKAKVQKAMDERRERTGIATDAVVDRLWAIATADPRELIELYRSCCRYCYGTDHRYQRTRGEMERDRAQHDADNEARVKANEPERPFDEQGGIGYNPKNDPHPDCPECFGDGVERVVAKDTRDLSPSARLLYAGVKTTQHGLQVLTHDQKATLVDCGRHLGIFKEKVELTGKNGGPIEHREKQLDDLLRDIDGAGTGLPRDAGTGD